MSMFTLSLTLLAAAFGGLALFFAREAVRAGVLQRAADRLPVAEFVTDGRGRVLSANAGARAIFGEARQPLPVLEMRLLADDEQSRQELTRLVNGAGTGRSGHAEITLAGPDSRPVIYEAHASPLDRPRGAVLWSLKDVTSERQLSTLLARERALLDELLDRVPVGLYMLDQDGRFLWTNETFAAWLGMTPERLVSEARRLIEFLPREGAEGAARPDLLAAVEALEVTLLAADGRRTQVAIGQSVRREGEALRTASVVRDLSPGRIRDEAFGLALQHFQRFFEIAPIGIALIDSEARFTESNRALNALLTDSREPLEGRQLLDFVSERDRTPVKQALAHVAAGEQQKRPVEIRLEGAAEKTVALFVSRLETADSRLGGEILHFIDMTEQKSLELQFSQSQKMQAVGQLAGGVAHDFNNLLTAMIGFCDLLLLRFRPGDQSFADVMQIKQNANRAANLVRQLLAFSRRQTLQPRVIDIGEVLAELRHLLNRLLGERVELLLVPSRDPATVKVDPGQLEQVIINLAVNARDAMRDGGSLTLRTTNVTLAKPLRQGAEVVPAGSYVLVEVNDTGTGIPPDIIGRIFEPFFSTKEVGSGTGLGLSTVYGIVKQTGGFIFVDSTVGEGTKFSIYLPRHAEAAVPAAAMADGEGRVLRDLTGAATVLLVEDETPVRMFSSRALRNKGYTVLEAKSGEQALDIISAADTPRIDLVITDVVMPRMDGPTLIRHVRERLPAAKVIFISGYTEELLAQRVAADEAEFLAKPFSLNQLAAKVKEVLPG